jgi:hypothetical protein
MSTETQEAPKTNKSNGGLWRKLSKDGKTPYFSGNLETENGKIFFKAFKNTFATEENNQPAYRLLIDVPFEEPAAPVKKVATAPKAAVAAKPVAKKVAPKPAPVVEEVVEEEQTEEVLLD